MPAVLAIGCVALLGLINRCATLRCWRGGTRRVVRQAGLALLLGSLALQIASIASPGIAVPLLALLALYDTTDITSFRFFGTSIASNATHLPVSWQSSGLLRIVRGYMRSYFSIRSLLRSCVVLAAAPLIAAALLPIPTAPTVGIAAAGILIGWIAATWRPRRSLDGLSATEREFVRADTTIAHAWLERRTRDGSVALAASPGSLPDCVLLVIVESGSASLRASDDPTLPLAGRIRQLSGAPDTWVVPTNFVTNSSCTDVILPAMLTGCGAHESIDKLHRLPFVFDLAKARGYRTSLFTASSLHWSDLDIFLAGAPLDAQFTAESSGQPFTHDLSIDDHVAARGLADWLDVTPQPAFAVWYSCALHVPFQTTSEIAIPPTLTARRARATYIVERELELLFDTLRAQGRFDRSLILVVGDHGEDPADVTAGDPSRLSRLTAFSDDVLHPLFLIKPPADLAAEKRDALRLNAERLMSHLDVAPTLADMFATGLAGGLAYAGQSLFRPIDRDRVVFAVNTNEWRSWPRSAVAICRDRARAIVDYLDDRLCRIEGAGGDELLACALDEPIVRKALSQIYRDRLGF